MKAVVALIVLLGVACATRGPEADCRAFHHGDPRDLGLEPFWPSGTFLPSGDDWSDGYISALLAVELCALGERPLIELDTAEAYRVIEFSYEPRMVRIQRIESRFALEATRLSNDGVHPRRIVESVSRELDREEWQRAVERIDASGFWAVAPLAPPAELTAMGGTLWLIEGKRADHQHVTVRSDPTAAYRDAVLYILQLSSLSLDGAR